MNERVPLSFLLAQNKDEEPPVEPTVPFAAMFGDDAKIVTAVLDRTAVLSEPSDRYERKSVRHDQVLVDPAVITWRTRTAEYDGTRLLTNTKPGAVGAALMGRHRRPARRLSAISITPGNVPGAEARQASDERALQNQREVEATKQRELAAHRKRQASAAPQITVKHEEEEAMSTVLQETAIITRPAAKEKLTKCFSCKEPKPAAEFPRPIHRGPNVCSSCTDAKGSASTATQTTATVAVEKTRKPRVHRKIKIGRAADKPRVGKTIPVGETAELVSTATNGATNNGDARQTKVLALMRRQDALRADLKRVSEEILELVAAG